MKTCNEHKTQSFINPRKEGLGNRYYLLKAGGGAGQTAIPYSLHAYMESFT